MEPQYLTVAEYAAKMGISKQAVYKQLNNKLKNRTTTVDIDGKPQKVIDIYGLFPEPEPEKAAKDSTGVDQPVNEVDQPVDNAYRDQFIAFLQEQIAEKDRQITNLTDALNQTAAALSEAQKSIQAAQALHAGTIRRDLQAGTAADQPEAEPEQAQPIPEQPELRISWWKRLWK